METGFGGSGCGAGAFLALTPPRDLASAPLPPRGFASAPRGDAVFLGVVFGIAPFFFKAIPVRSVLVPSAAQANPRESLTKP
jgi:hypothetical protein